MLLAVQEQIAVQKKLRLTNEKTAENLSIQLKALVRIY